MCFVDFIFDNYIFKSRENFKCKTLDKLEGKKPMLHRVVLS